MLLITKPKYSTQNPRKVFIFVKANWTMLKGKCLDICTTIKNMYEEGENTNSLWEAYKTFFMSDIETHIPSKTFRQRKSPPWYNCRLCRLTRHKLRLGTV